MHSILVELIVAPKEALPNGSHTDYYAQLARTQKGARHPLDYAASDKECALSSSRLDRAVQKQGDMRT